MLLYSNRSFFPLVLSRKGHAFKIRILLGGGTIAGLTFLLSFHIAIDSEFAPRIPHHYGMIVTGAIVSLALAYRTRVAWMRYWEAITQQHNMYSKWSDAYAQFFAFAMVTIATAEKAGGEASEEKIVRVNDSLDRLERNFSLLSAFAAHRLTHGDNERMAQRAYLGAKWNDRVVLRRELRVGEDLTNSGDLPKLKVCKDGTLRKSTGLHSAWKADFRVVREPSEEEQKFLKESKDRVSAIMYWIIHDLSQVSNDLVVAPPIQSRMYQELSNGMLGFNNSLKIADVPFPFPYAQLLTWILLGFSSLIPVYVSAFTTSLIVSPIAAFLAFLGIWSVNEVAVELENPFGSDDNDISCWDFHERFIDVLREQRGVHQVKEDEERLAKHMQDITSNFVVSPSLTAESGTKEEDSAVELEKASPLVLDALAKSPSAADVKSCSTGPFQDMCGHNDQKPRDMNSNGTSMPQFESSPSGLPPDAGDMHSSRFGLPEAARVAEVCDRQLTEVTRRIELQLSRIVRQLEARSNSGHFAISRSASNRSPTPEGWIPTEGRKLWDLASHEDVNRQVPSRHEDDAASPWCISGTFLSRRVTPPDSALMPQHLRI